MDTRDVHELAEQRRAQDDGKHHRRGARAVGEDLTDLRQREIAPREREQQRCRRADARGFHRGEQAAIDSAHDDAEDRGHGPQGAQQRAPVHLHALRARGRLRRVAPNHVANRDHVPDDGHEARHDAGREQHADVGLRGHAVDHHDHRGRDQNAQRAACGNSGGGQLVAIAEAAHFGDGDLPHGGRRRHTGATDGAKAAAGDHGGHRHTAAAPPDQGLRSAEQVTRNAGARHEVAHQDEQRQYDERVD
ncbi:hypothetical protein D9M68_764630 [compost metagenome]